MPSTSQEEETFCCTAYQGCCEIFWVFGVTTLCRNGNVEQIPPTAFEIDKKANPRKKYYYWRQAPWDPITYASHILGHSLGVPSWLPLPKRVNQISRVFDHYSTLWNYATCCKYNSLFISLTRLLHRLFETLFRVRGSIVLHVLFSTYAVRMYVLLPRPVRFLVVPKSSVARTRENQ